MNDDRAMEKHERQQALLALIRDTFCQGVGAELARKIGKDATYVNRLFYPSTKNGAKKIGPEITDACNETFSLPRGFWDMTLEEAVAELNADPASTSAPAGGRDRPRHVRVSTSGEAATEYLPGFRNLSIPLLANSGAMGDGDDQLHDEVVVGRITVSPDWAIRTLKPTNLEALKFIHGYGDSMDPTFSDGDVLLVDTGVVEPKVDGVYVLSANDRIYIKRVRQRLDGTFEISSDNPTVKTVDVLDGSNQVSIRGRVVWAWNGKKL